MDAYQITFIVAFALGMAELVTGAFLFLGLAIGFALPFVAVAFTPGLLGRLPRPGPWMETFKKLLAFRAKQTEAAKAMALPL